MRISEACKKLNKEKDKKKRELLIFLGEKKEENNDSDALWRFSIPIRGSYKPKP
jgi:hypothetical protein